MAVATATHNRAHPRTRTRSRWRDHTLEDTCSGRTGTFAASPFIISVLGVHDGVCRWPTPIFARDRTFANRGDRRGRLPRARFGDAFLTGVCDL